MREEAPTSAVASPLCKELSAQPVTDHGATTREHNASNHGGSHHNSFAAAPPQQQRQRQQQQQEDEERQRGQGQQQRANQRRPRPRHSEREKLQRPHSYLGFSKGSRFSTGINFYSSKYKRSAAFNGNDNNNNSSSAGGRGGGCNNNNNNNRHGGSTRRNSSTVPWKGRPTSSRRHSTLRPNKSSGDLREELISIQLPQHEQDLLDSIPTYTNRRNLISSVNSVSPSQTIRDIYGQTTSGFLTQRRSQSVLSTRSSVGGVHRLGNRHVSSSSSINNIVNAGLTNRSRLSNYRVVGNVNPGGRPDLRDGQNGDNDDNDDNDDEDHDEEERENVWKKEYRPGTYYNNNNNNNSNNQIHSRYPINSNYRTVLNSNSDNSSTGGGGGGGGGRTPLTKSRPSVGASSSSNTNNVNSVTFNLPDDDDSGSSSEQSAVYGQFNISAAAYRRMSAPELPPINVTKTSKNGRSSSNNSRQVKGDKRKTSNNSKDSSGSKASINQISAAVNSKTYYNRRANNTTTTGGNNNNNNSSSHHHTKKKKLPIPRNHSDSSLKGLQYGVKESPGQSQGSESINSTQGGGNNPDKAKLLANNHRALSWCATDNSGSQNKLETLFEGPKNVNSQHNSTNVLSSQSNNSRGGTPTILGSGANVLAGLWGAKKTNSSTSLNLLPHNNSGSDLPSMVGQRSVSVNGVRSREEVTRLQSLNRKLLNETADDEEIATVDEFLTKGRMKRCSSENKLTGKLQLKNHSLQQQHHNQQHHNSSSSLQNPPVKTSGGGGGLMGSAKPQPASRGLSRNLSVDRIDKLSKPARKSVTSKTPAPGALTPRMRRVNSVAAIGGGRHKSRSRHNSSNKNETPAPVTTAQDEVFDDEESFETNLRLVEWLDIVNNVEEYDTDPKDTYIEYVDEPPQTDTAVHVVYDGE